MAQSLALAIHISAFPGDNRCDTCARKGFLQQVLSRLDADRSNCSIVQYGNGRDGLELNGLIDHGAETAKYLRMQLTPKRQAN